MIQAEQETPAETEKAAERAGETGSQNGAQDAPPVRETFIVVPGPTVWRIRGVLTAARGMLALEDHDGVLWYLPGLDRYIGFIDGLDAGEEAALEGYAPPGGSSQERYFQPIRLFIDDMAYDLTIPPYGIGIPGSGGRQTMRIESWAAPGSGTGLGDDPRYQSDPWDEGDRDGETPVEERRRTRRERGREPGPPPAWNHPHKSPWAPPPTVLEFEMDYDSFWREDEAKQRRRERDSREIWY
jgi:hypothetical protein